MFSAKLFNSFTALLAIIFFLSATISTLSDIRKENSIRMEFSQLLQDVDVFNNQHSSFLEENGGSSPHPISEIDSYNTGTEALASAYKNYKEASSYYSEAYGKITVADLISVELFITTAKYENGDFVQQIVAKEVGTFFGGKVGAMIAFYKKEVNLVYRNFTWNVPKVQNKWKPNFVESWQIQTLNQYIEEFGALPGTSIYDVTQRTLVEQLFFQKQRDSQNKVREYHIQHTLNPTLTTKLYKGFISYVLSVVEPDFVKSVAFKELTVSAIVDCEGNLKMARYKEVYNFTVYVRQWGINVSATCNSEITYMFASFNQPINFERPAV